MKAMIHNRVWDPQNDIKPTKKITIENIFKNSYKSIMKDKKQKQKQKKKVYVTY